MNKSIKKLIVFVITAAVMFSLIPASASYFPESSGHVAIAVTPGELAQAGPVTVTVVLRNTNSSVQPTETPTPITSPDPSVTPAPISTPTPGGKTSGDNSYYDISISNSYGVTFNTSGVVVTPGSQSTFTGTLNATDEMIGVPLSFTVSWTFNGTRYAETVSCTIIRRNVAPYLQVTRTATPSKAAPGTDVTLKYTFTNTGSVTLVNISLSDRQVYGRSAAMYTINTLEPGASNEFVYVMRMGSSTVTSSPVVTFYAYGGTTQLVNNVAPLTIGLIQSQLEKEVVMGESTPEGVMFTLYLTNNGNQKLSNLKVTDDLGNSVTAQAFSLAVGESTVINYFVPDPDAVRYVVFYIKGNDNLGTEFRDNTSSFIVRPYIDKSLEGLTFSAAAISSMNEERVLLFEFAVANTGSLELFNLSLTEQALDYEIHRWKSLGVGESDKQQINVNIGEVRNLIFVLTAEDSSGNVYTYEAHIATEEIDISAMVPDDDPSKSNQDVSVVEDTTDLSMRLDGLMTDVGEKLQKWFRILGIVAAVAAVLFICLGVTEIVLNRNKRANGKKNG